MLSARGEQGMDIIGEGSEFPNDAGGRDAFKPVVEKSTLTCSPGAVHEDTDR